MGLASAMSTALTGLTASETTIDVVGNNLANSNTVGFKASTATFATQFLQTQSLGSAPTDNSGGTNPRQSGLGAMVAEITPNFEQGTVDISSSPTDLAIQGDGFYIVPRRHGRAPLHPQRRLQDQRRESTGDGHGQSTDGVRNQQPVPDRYDPVGPRCKSPLGTATVAKATENVVLEGTLTPTGDIANTAAIIQTGVLTDGSKSFPTSGPGVGLGGAGQLSGKYKYYVTFANGNVESRPQVLPVDSPLLDNNQVVLSNMPTDTTGQWLTTRIYRSVNDQAGDTNFYEITELPTTTTDPLLEVNDNYSDADIRAGTFLVPPGTHVLSMFGPGVNNDTPAVGRGPVRRHQLPASVSVAGRAAFHGQERGTHLGGEGLHRQGHDDAAGICPPSWNSRWASRGVPARIRTTRFPRIRRAGGPPEAVSRPPAPFGWWGTTAPTTQSLSVCPDCK